MVLRPLRSRESDAAENCGGRRHVGTRSAELPPKHHHFPCIRSLLTASTRTHAREDLIAHCVHSLHEVLHELLRWSKAVTRSDSQ